MMSEGLLNREDAFTALYSNQTVITIPYNSCVEPGCNTSFCKTCLEFLNSSALHKPTTETGKQRMKTDPLLKYIAEIYSGKTLSNANEALLGAYLIPHCHRAVYRVAANHLGVVWDLCCIFCHTV